MPQFWNLNIQFHEVIKTSNLTQNEFFYPLSALTWFRLKLPGASLFCSFSSPNSLQPPPASDFSLLQKIEGK